MEIIVYIVLVISLIFLILIFNSVGLKYELGQGKIVAKEYTPSYRAPVWNQTLKMMTYVYHSQSFVVRIEFRGKTDDVQLSKAEYDGLKLNQIISIKYAYGRFWKSLHIGAIEK